MKITTIADALKCVSKVNQGKACSAAEMKATIILLDRARKTAVASARQAKKALKASDNMVTRLLSKVGL